METLDKLDYPKDSYEVLIGNDDSTDGSRAIIQNYIQQKSNFYLVDIEQNQPKTQGKANVLAQLAQKAKGEFYFFTDADTHVPTSWFKSILKEFDSQTGIVVGSTSLYFDTFFAKMQSIDWLFALSIIKKISDKGIPVTALGNNMAVRKEAYLQTGTYQNIPFSITEDFALFQAIIAQNWDFKQVVNKEVLAFSQAQSSVMQWLGQRKRWMRGALQTKWYLQLALLSYVLLFPLLFVGIWSFPIQIMLFWAIKISLQTLFIHKKSKELNLNFKFSSLLFYEFYVLFMYPLLIVFYFLPIKISWKGRVY